MVEPKQFAYLDHNVLDQITKGDPDSVVDLLERWALIPVFSNENLAEICRSIGHEKSFLELLDRIKARYLVPVLDARLKHTGGAEIRQVSPFEAYNTYKDGAHPLPPLGFGLAGMLQKFYGGRQNQTFAEIFSQGADELRELLKTVENELQELPGLQDHTRATLSGFHRDLPGMMREQYRSFAAQMDADPNAFVKQLEQASGLGPKVLNNIRGPDVLRQIWKLVENRYPSAAGDLETFFGIKPLSFDADAGRERTMLEKVNGIYHQLNFLGYYRDSQMSRQRRFVASFSDMTHAGLATFCHVLICRDEDFVMKAAAAYEYVNVRTRILYFGANTPMEPRV
jgi:hypothetical protein